MASYSPFQIVIPVYDDWESVGRLLPMIDEQLEKSGREADVLLADDGSRTSPPEVWPFTPGKLRTVRILKLKRNLGHQRAICVALCHLHDQPECQRVLIMDGDGEDAPSDIPRLLDELDKGEAQVVFAERVKRSEGWCFSFFYFLYRFLHRVLVGHRVRVGNFSVMNRRSVESLCVSWELWNHYAAAVFATRLPIALVPTHRAKRLVGESRMNFPALVMHGLSALSVFSDRITTRLLLVSGLGTVAAVIGLLIVTVIRLATPYAIPGWATNAFGILLLLLIQFVAIILTCSLMILFTRGLSQFTPAREYGHFVSQIEEARHG